MWNYCSYDTEAFSNLNKMDKNDIEVASGTQLVRSLNIFSTWMMSQSRRVLDGQKKLCCSPEFMPKAIRKFCVTLKRKIIPVRY